MKKLFFILIVATMAVPGTAMAFDHSYKLWNRDLKQFNQNGYIHYGAWQSNRGHLDQFLKAMQSVTHREISGWSAAQRHAFWINTYNALVVIRILEVYPNINRMHHRKWIIAGQTMKIEAIRDKILRGTESRVLLLSDTLARKTSMASGKDLRILFAICEGTQASAPLAAKAYTAKHLSRQLDKQTKLTLSSASFLRAEPRLKIFHVGSLFRTYQRDFKEYQGNPLLFEHSAGSDKGVLRFAFNYLDQPTQDAVLAKQRWPWRVNYRPAHQSLNGGD